MSIPKDVQDAIGYIHCVVTSSHLAAWEANREQWQMVYNHLMHQDAELTESRDMAASLNGDLTAFAQRTTLAESRLAELEGTLSSARTVMVEFDETIDGEHVGVIPLAHSEVGNRYKLVPNPTTDSQKAES